MKLFQIIFKVQQLLARKVILRENSCSKQPPKAPCIVEHTCSPSYSGSRKIANLRSKQDPVSRLKIKMVGRCNSELPGLILSATKKWRKKLTRQHSLLYGNKGNRWTLILPMTTITILGLYWEKNLLSNQTDFTLAVYHSAHKYWWIYQMSDCLMGNVPKNNNNNNSTNSAMSINLNKPY